MPKTIPGKWSIQLILIFVVLFVSVQIIAAVGRSQGAFDSNSINIYKILIPLAVIPAGICGIGAFLSGVVSIIRNRERSVLVFLATMFGFFVLVFVVGEFIFPH